MHEAHPALFIENSCYAAVRNMSKRTERNSERQGLSCK